jgi:hypothetical protein
MVQWFNKLDAPAHPLAESSNAAIVVLCGACDSGLIFPIQLVPRPLAEIQWFEIMKLSLLLKMPTKARSLHQTNLDSLMAASFSAEHVGRFEKNALLKPVRAAGGGPLSA